MILVVIGLVVFSIFTRLQVMALRKQLYSLQNTLWRAKDVNGQYLFREPW